MLAAAVEPVAADFRKALISRLVSTTVYHLSTSQLDNPFGLQLSVTWGVISVMSSMECSKIPGFTSKFSQWNRILSRQSAFGNETGKLAIGEYW
jgi:hypothetical protein